MVLVCDPLLGTRAEISVVAAESAEVGIAEKAVLAEIERLERVFSMFDERSALCAYRLSGCLLYTSPSPRDATLSRMPSSA